MDTQAVKLDDAIEFSLRGSFGAKAMTMASHARTTASQPFFLNTVLQQTTAMTLAGGQGERLSPLTRDRAKPAVPFGGIYRIIDFTIYKMDYGEMIAAHLERKADLMIACTEVP